MATKLPQSTESTPSFASLLGSATSLGKAVDDGYRPTDRADLRDQPLIIDKYTINTNANGKWSRIWAVTTDGDGNPVKVKFEDGGRSMNSITTVLEELTRLRIRGGVAVILRGEDYRFPNKETGEPEIGVRYTFEEYAG